MPLIPKEKVEEIKERATIYEVISYHAPEMELKKAGKNYVGICPFHGGKSFNVHPHHNIYKCYGCNKSGDSVNFLMLVKNKTFPEALRALAEQFNILID